ncbi:MAG: SprT family zinc-dependent metalloprotease [Proteobacteria bacterium]|nr:SprT family zinc-dependent metalloprotease [Pseudomonadota bacterium]
MKSTTDAIQVRRSAKAKRLRLAVKPGLIELVIPRGIGESQAMAFLDKHRFWAEGKLLELNDRASRIPPVGNFASSPTLPWRGNEVPLIIREAPGLRVRVALDEAVHIALPEGLGEARDEVALRAFYAWVRRWLRGQVAVLAERHAPRCKLRPREIRVKRMKTRWGSCGPRNDMNINWLLALAPESVLEYVVVHELCHVSERNHSPAFWSLVAMHLPNYAEEKRWLKLHGAELMRRFNR